MMVTRSRLYLLLHSEVALVQVGHPLLEEDEGRVGLHPDLLGEGGVGGLDHGDLLLADVVVDVLELGECLQAVVTLSVGVCTKDTLKQTVKYLSQSGNKPVKYMCFCQILLYNKLDTK